MGQTSGKCSGVLDVGFVRVSATYSKEKGGPKAGAVELPQDIETFCSFVSRYYLIWGIIILPLFPKASAILVGTHLLTGLVEYFTKKPKLHPVWFLFYFSLEQLFYQLGVWWGCIKYASFRAVLPRIKINPFFQQI